MTVRNVLVPTDLSPAAEQAFGPAAALALRFGATITVVQVTADADAPDAGRVVRTDGPDIGDEAFELVPVVDVEVEASDVAAALAEQVRRTGADLVVMGTHGRSGLSRLRLGSVTEDLIRSASCPVLAVRADVALDGWHPSRVLAAVDPVDLAPAALGPAGLGAEDVPVPVQLAADLAAAFEADLDLVTVAEGSVDGAYPSLRRCAAGLLALTVRLSYSDPAPRRIAYSVRQGTPAAVVVAEAERSGAGLVVVGTHARRGLRRLALGSVAESVSQSSSCPVLIANPLAAAAPHGRALRGRAEPVPLAPA